MPRSTSALERTRRSGAHQIPQQRAAILDAAEELFLRRGIEPTTMVDIAARAGITKITLYRYFPNRDAIALEIHQRAIQRLAEVAGPPHIDFDAPDAAVVSIRAMVRNFDALQDAFRFMGMFDQTYLDRASDTPLTRWVKEQIAARRPDANPKTLMHSFVDAERVTLAMNAMTWFLEKLAMRGELSWGADGVSLQRYLLMFEDMIVGFLKTDSLIRPDSPSETHPGLPL
jgi:AcrR family transcriptional regulator